MTQTSKPPLAGCRVLVVEDRYFIADEICHVLGALGAEVVGPFPDIAAAAEGAEAGALDLALLDVNLEGEMVYPVVERLEHRGVPFIFVTGYDDWVLPEPWRERPRLTKPVSRQTLTDEVLKVVRKP